jgi:hypothetical protein
LSDEGKKHESGTFHNLRYKWNHGMLVMATNRGWLVRGDGTPAPPMTSFAASKSFSRSVVATIAHDMTLVGGASFNGGIFLVAAVVDWALKGCMAGERMNKSFGIEVREREMSWGI